MPSNAFAAKSLGAERDVVAPDGSEVRLLCATGRGSMAHFRLPPGAIAKAARHKSVEEIWYVVGGRGRLWRSAGGEEDIADLAPASSVVIPTGAHFQFRNDGAVPLDIVAVTMPPWPGADEAELVAGPWQPIVD